MEEEDTVQQYRSEEQRAAELNTEHDIIERSMTMDRQ